METILIIQKRKAVDFKSLFLATISIGQMAFGMITINNAAVVIGMLVGISAIIYNVVKTYAIIKDHKSTK